LSVSAFDTGQVGIRLAVAEGRVAAVSVASERPQVAALLRGRPADEAVRLAPLLFSLCGRAQGRAAALALDAARGAEVPPCLDAAVEAEALREHLWRLLLDLPPLLGFPAQRELFLAATQAVAAGDRAGLRGLLAQAAWDELRQGWRALDQPEETAAPLLPELEAADSLAVWPRLTAAFAARPEWRGAAAETGAFARRQGAAGAVAPAFAARWQARLDELTTWAEAREKVGAGGTASSASAAPGIGRALVATARGLLMHEIVLDGGRIDDYVIVAPTEWNFHPRGRLAAWLVGTAADDAEALRKRVGPAVSALDPCVRWTLEIRLV
jgi:hypothetical protein